MLREHSSRLDSHAARSQIAEPAMMWEHRNRLDIPSEAVMLWEHRIRKDIPSDAAMMPEHRNS